MKRTQVSHAWHEQIQRYVNGQASAAEVAALQSALREDAELRMVYLDYMNLDVALAAAAAAATISDEAIGLATIVPVSKAQPFPAQSSSRMERWLAIGAACTALVVVMILLRNRGPALPTSNVAAVCSSSQAAVARLSINLPNSFPAWASPTASLLPQPQATPKDM